MFTGKVGRSVVGETDYTKLLAPNSLLQTPYARFHQHSTSSFSRTDPKSTKKTVVSLFFALLGSARVKAASRTLMKLTPGWDQGLTSQNIGLKVICAIDLQEGCYRHRLPQPPSTSVGAHKKEVSCRATILRPNR